ncbi:MAG: carboxypeptidase-like regulatory domain-containing protein [bacterium]
MKKMKWLAVFLLFLNLGCYRGLIKRQENFHKIEGAVSYKDETLPGASVEIFLESGISKDGIDAKPFARLKTGPDGQFAVNLPQDSYYFRAWKPKDESAEKFGEGDYFCYYGGNPVAVIGSRKDLFLKCVKIHTLKKEDKFDLSKPELTGTIIDVNGRPLENAYVYLFSVSNPDSRRAADILSEPTLKDGSFSIMFDTAGSYFLMARRRQNTEEKGPLKIGDYYGYYYGNPLEIKEKTKRHLILECVEKKKDYLPVNFNVPEGKSAIRGRITDKNGNPISGVFAFTYRDEFNTGKKPDYKSMITGEDGLYTILIGEPGFYVVGARKTHGGPPEPGDIYGVYDNASNNKLKIKKGEVVNNINIIVEDIK